MYAAVLSLQRCCSEYTGMLIVNWHNRTQRLSWFRSDTVQFRVSKTTLPLPCFPPLSFFPPPPPAAAEEESWRHKRQKSRVEVRTIYWKCQWDKKTNGKNKNIDNKSVLKRECRAQSNCSQVTKPLPPGRTNITQTAPCVTLAPP